MEDLERLTDQIARLSEKIDELVANMDSIYFFLKNRDKVNANFKMSMPPPVRKRGAYKGADAKVRVIRSGGGVVRVTQEEYNVLIVTDIDERPDLLKELREP